MSQIVSRAQYISLPEAMFMQHLRGYKLNEGWETEHAFHPTRKWRFDFARKDIKLAIEIEGGTYSGGRHTRGAGYEADCHKYNEAARLGWTVLRFTSRMVSSGQAILFLKDFLNSRQEPSA